MNSSNSNLLATLLCLIVVSGAKAQVQVDSLPADRISDFRENMIDWTGQDLLDASFPNSWPIFGAKARLGFGGYVKLDYIQDFNGIYDRFQVTAENIQVPGDGRPEQAGYMNLFARESRFNLDFRGETDLGDPFRVFVEIDFWNLDRAPFSQAPRLRHVYGVYDRLLIGRTWGTASDLYAVPVTIDFEAGDALAGTRRAQVRWEDHVTETIKYAVGIEMLEYAGIDPVSQQGSASQNLPLLAARLTKSTANGGRLFLAASVYQLRWNPENSSETSTAPGWGVSFSGREYFGQKKHYAFWQVSYGNGWGSNILTFIGDGSATINPDGEIETMAAYSYGGGFVYNISPVIATSVNTFWTAIDPTDDRDEHTMYKGGTVHANIVWSPVKKINAGIEYIYGKRTNVSELFGEAHRMQMMIKYIIN